VVDLSVKRELNRGSGDALSTAFELSVTPILMGLIGYGLDRWLGTRPFLMIAIFVFTFGYEIWKLFKRYELRMTEQQAKVKGLRPAPGAEGPTKPTTTTGPEGQP
jgi:F0F1-type ATP synthase assembly protein I